MGELMSSCLDIACGVHQRSVLRPVLFIIYINDTCKTSVLLKLVLFVDDTFFFFLIGEDSQQLLKLITPEMSK